MSTIQMCRWLLSLLLVAILQLPAPLVFAADGSGESKKLVIAHRGASGYLPEHTLAAKAMAHAMGADFIEQDIVLTRDAVPVVLHDIHLDTVTDVAKVFPNRARADGRYYAIDFTLDEIRRLRVSERFDREAGTPVYGERFPPHKARFAVPTLAEEIELIQGLNKSTSRDVGIYPEIKSPAWHREQNHDISQIVLAVLAKYGYRTRQDKVFLQCFDAAECKRLRKELGAKIRLVQLIGENDWNEAPTDFDVLRTPAGLREIATYADGIGPWMKHVVEEPAAGGYRVTGLVEQAHRVGLTVHPYTFRADALPGYAKDLDVVLAIYFDEAQVDGVFTDFPDRVVRFRAIRSAVTDFRKSPLLEDLPPDRRFKLRR